MQEDLFTRRSSEQNYPWDLLDALRNTLFTLHAQCCQCISGPCSLVEYLVLVDYLNIYSDEESAYDILLLLDVMKTATRLTIYTMPLFVLFTVPEKKLPQSMPLTMRVYQIWFSPAILTAVRPQPSATPTDDGPDRFFENHRDLCYLQLVFSLVRNSNWYPHLFGGHHIDCCISTIILCCKLFRQRALYLTGIFLPIAPEQLSAVLLDSITEQQWWDMINACMVPCLSHN
ncbi:hypothetical protein F4604DRAFT_914800 [Suillus subluteus]|nr:hypothetical protein F4604DRAFT_1300894 [Suillus subluteus]KAG1868532.1 hypothetical protein F4604DRAFT_914800 [Suillus subluteus]